MHTVGGRHAFKDYQEGWYETVPGDLQHEILAKPFDYTMQTHVHHNLPEFMNTMQKPIVINYEHITTPELLTKCAKGEVSAKGFHHDYMRAIEKSGLIEVKNKTMLSCGCYQFEWRGYGAEFKPSTIFPAEWTQAQTIEKIYESMKNTIEIFYEKGTRYQHLGLTTEGIPVLSVIETKGNIAKMITAYPDFDTYRKLLEGKVI